MPRFVQLSLLLHALVPPWLLWRWEDWPWALALLGLDHALLTLCGLWPRSTALGANLVRLPADARARGEVVLTLDDGPDPEVTPRVLDLLDAHGVKATFFCIGERVQRHPGLAREILARGHDLENHSQCHRHHFSLLGPRGFAREIASAQQSFEAVTGRRPRFFRAPAGLRNPFLAPVLHRLGLQLVSWSARGYDTRERDPQRVLQRLTRRLRAGDILLLHDGHAARDAQGEPVLLAVLPGLLRELAQAGLRPVRLSDALAPAAARSLQPRGDRQRPAVSRPMGLSSTTS